MLKANIVVQGRVQGVGFRYFVVDLAEKMELDGEVWNNYDGTVEMNVYCENKDVLTKFCDEVKKGPPLSRVLEMRVNVAATDPPLNKGFGIKQ